MFAFLLLSCSYPIRGALVYLNSKNTHILFVYRARRWFICTLSVKTVLGKKCALTLAESYDYSLLNKYVLLLPFRRRRLWRFLLYIINDVWITKYISTKKVSYERAPACDKYSVLRAHTHDNHTQLFVIALSCSVCHVWRYVYGCRGSHKKGKRNQKCANGKGVRRNKPLI